MMEVLETSALNTVQDLGRFGYRHLGVGTSGVMDPLALEIGNILLLNPRNAACIELQTFPFSIRFNLETSFAVTGIDARIELDGQRVLPWTANHALAGQVLQISAPHSGARGYICVSGGVDVPIVLGSRSTQLRGGFGGHQGRPLQAGDTLSFVGGPQVDAYGASSPARILTKDQDRDDGAVILRVIPATDFELFTEKSRDFLFNTPWRITPQSDRVGYRLDGERLSLTTPLELRSYGVVPGIIQVPPAGSPIVQMADANTAGGYPRIATVIEADLWRLAQVRIGKQVYFAPCRHTDAVSAMVPITHYLENLRTMVALYSRSARRRETHTYGSAK